MSFQKYIGAGVQWASFGLVASEYNRLLDTDGAQPAQGAAGSMLRLIGIQVANTGFPEDDSVTVPGDDKSQGSIDFESDAPTAFVIELGVFDLDQEAILQGTSVYSLGDFRFGARRPLDSNKPDGCLIVQSKSKQKTSLSGGAKGWNGLIYPRLTLQPLGENDRTGRTAISNRYYANAQPATHFPWGFTFGENNLGTAETYAIPFTSLYPLYMQPIVLAGGGNETFNLDYTPASTDKIHNKLIVGSAEAGDSDYTISQSAPQLTVNTSYAAGTQATLIYGVKI